MSGYCLRERESMQEAAYTKGSLCDVAVLVLAGSCPLHVLLLNERFNGLLNETHARAEPATQLLYHLHNGNRINNMTPYDTVRY